MERLVAECVCFGNRRLYSTIGRVHSQFLYLGTPFVPGAKYTLRDEGGIFLRIFIFLGISSKLWRYTVEQNRMLHDE